jgi:hypothetical protein
MQENGMGCFTAQALLGFHPKKQTMNQGSFEEGFEAGFPLSLF